MVSHKNITVRDMGYNDTRQKLLKLEESFENEIDMNLD